MTGKWARSDGLTVKRMLDRQDRQGVKRGSLNTQWCYMCGASHDYHAPERKSKTPRPTRA